MNPTVTGPALTAEAVQAVVTAAAALRHAVVGHALPASLLPDEAELERLAAELPKGWVRGIDGGVAEFGSYGRELGAVLPHHTDRPTVTRLYHVQRSPRFRPWTDSVYDPLEAAWPTSEPWLDRDAGFFVSSSDGVTPAHGDRHHNLLVQVIGAKEIGVVLPGSRAHAEAVARSFPTLRVDAPPPGALTLTLQEGQALYLPPYAIHWVRSTSRSVALSCGWSSAATVRAGEVHAVNGALLRRGVPIWLGPASLRLALRSSLRRLRR